MSFLSFLRGVEDPTAPKRVTSVSASKPPRPSGKPISGKTFTAAEVAQHATESDCYTIVEGRVYDVTKYLRLHPGGMKLMFKNAGGDSTADFLALRHSVKSRTILDHYYVGELATGHPSTLSVHTGQPARPVGSLVGSQPFLSLAPTGHSSGVVTPSPSTERTYPPPRSGALHPSSSHPDRLSAYREQAQSLSKSSRQLPTIIASSPSTSSESSDAANGLSIQLHPPAPRTPPSSSALKLHRSPTTEALEQHLASELINTPSDESMDSEVDSSASPPLSMVAPVRAQSSEPSKPARVRAPLPPVPRFEDAAAASSSIPMDTSENVAATAMRIELPQNVAAAASSVSYSAGTSVLSSSASASATSTAAAAIPAGLGPRPFVLVKRVQKTPDVQHLTFEPSFPGSSSTHSASQTSASSTGSSAVSPSHPSALDPALWLHVPCGLHVSLGVTMPDGSYLKRPYTPTANSRGMLEFVIKCYPEPYGVLSRYLHVLPLSSTALTTAPPTIDVWGPFGRFSYEHGLASFPRRWILLAQGTGVAPMYQLLKFHTKEVQDQREGKPNGYPKYLTLHLLTCYRKVEDRLLVEELHELKQQAQDRITVQHLISQRSDAASSSSTSSFDGVCSRLDAATLDRYLTSLKDPSAATTPPTLFLLCGSDEFHLQCMAMLLASPLGAKSEEEIFCF